MAINNSSKKNLKKQGDHKSERWVRERQEESEGNRMNHKLRVYIFPLSLALHVQHINSHNGFWRRIQLDGDEKCKMDFKNPPIHTWYMHISDDDGGGEKKVKFKEKHRAIFND